jgi:hypothetical protein
VRNHSIMYAVLRRDEDLGRDVVVCFTNTLDRAEALQGEYEQALKDVNGDTENNHYYVVSNVFYNG